MLEVADAGVDDMGITFGGCILQRMKCAVHLILWHFFLRQHKTFAATSQKKKTNQNNNSEKTAITPETTQLEEQNIEPVNFKFMPSKHWTNMHVMFDALSHFVSV